MAQVQNKPILLSIGYAACHWCHVMAHESFESAETAALMNQYFINIKVDREERPDVDMVYQNALALLGQQGGWPLTMFLTPGREPFWGGTYFPPLPRHGLPGFREVLRGVHESWSEQQDKITHNVKSLTAALQKLQERQEGHIVSREMLDPHQPVFPLAHRQRERRHWRGAEIPVAVDHRAVVGRLYPYRRRHLQIRRYPEPDAYVPGAGLYDHIGGGFCRYTVDGEWLVPHFEKMLYDNGLFLGMLSEVYRETQNPLFAQRLRETAAWLQRDMAVTHNGATGFASSYDADSMDATGHAEEGAYYIWRSAEVDDILGADAAFFKKAYDITQGGNWEGVNIPNRLQQLSLLSESDEIKLKSLRAKLKDRRDTRIPPARDGKVLADWNGLAIAGLLRASFALDAPDLLKAAAGAFGFITRNMMEEDGRLWHSFLRRQDRACRHSRRLRQHDRGRAFVFRADRKRRLSFASRDMGRHPAA